MELRKFIFLALLHRCLHIETSMIHQKMILGVMTFRSKGLTFQLPGFVVFAHSNLPVQEKRKKKMKD